MQPLTDWSVLDGVVVALFALIVICQLVLRRQRRGKVTAPADPESEFVSDIPLMVVLAGSFVPWWPWLGELIVVAGCLAWLACYLRMKGGQGHP